MMDDPLPTPTPPAPAPIRKPLSRRLRTLLPFVVSLALLGWLFSRIDLREALAFVTWDRALRFVGPLLVFNFFTLAIEARCLNRVAAASQGTLSLATAARIKAASYLLSLMNYALGAAALSLLFRRRSEVSLADAAGMVFLISLFDLGSVLSMAALGAVWIQSDALGIRAGLIVFLIAAIVAGFVFLRAPISLGPLDRLRELEIFRAPRTAPIGLMIELALLRIVFLLSFVALTASLFWAFGLSIDPWRLAFNVPVMIVVSIVPVAAGGLGTGQIVFVELFRGVAAPAELLAASIVFSLGIMSARALLGLCFAPEFAREALEANRQGAAE